MISCKLTELLKLIQAENQNQTNRELRYLTTSCDNLRNDCNKALSLFVEELFDHSSRHQTVIYALNQVIFYKVVRNFCTKSKRYFQRYSESMH